jgi:hypothetical protein
VRNHGFVSRQGGKKRLGKGVDLVATWRVPQLARGRSRNRYTARDDQGLRRSTRHYFFEQCLVAARTGSYLRAGWA